EIQFLDIKELNDLAAEYRARLRDLTAACRETRTRAQNQENGATNVRQLYAGHEALFLRRQITDLWQVYRIVIADSHEMTADYLAQLARKSHKNFRSSLPTWKNRRAAA